MYCMRCNKNIINCTCPDIEERLNSLGTNPVLSIAIESNLIERKMKATQDTLCACKEVKEQDENTPEKR